MVSLVVSPDEQGLYSGSLLDIGTRPPRSQDLLRAPQFRVSPWSSVRSQQ